MVTRLIRIAVLTALASTSAILLAACSGSPSFSAGDCVTVEGVFASMNEASCGAGSADPMGHIVYRVAGVVEYKKTCSEYEDVNLTLDHESDDATYCLVIV